MEKRDFLKLIGASGVAMVAPKLSQAEQPEEEFGTGAIQFGILPGGDGPGEIVFDGDVKVPFLKHPQTLLVMCAAEFNDKEDRWEGCYVNWRPLKNTSTEEILKEMGYFCLQQWGEFNNETDYEDFSGGERLDDEKISLQLQECEKERRKDNYV
jgi:hypothetical protein